jgi:hypothetical protein
MPNEQPSKPRWSRWAPIVKTTPSGKTQFVCLVCGNISMAPMLECSPSTHKSVLDCRLRDRFDSAYVTCSRVEEHINTERQKRMPEHLVLDWHENKLRSETNKYCELCHGYGCQHCIGKGTRW